MIIHNVEQGSQEWLNLRLTKFTASEAPAMMGASKYTNRGELLRLKATGNAPEVSAQQQAIFDKGHETEAAARAILEARLGEDLFPIVGSEGKLLASVDGMDLMGAVAFEHKLLNQSLVGQIAAGELEPHYYWQLEQIILVTGVEAVIFVCSDGTAENWHELRYEAVPGRAEQLKAGWAQFEADLAAWAPTEKAAPVVGASMESLPALRIAVTGMVTASNLDQYKAAALEAIGSINTNLQSDQDFADAEKAVKFCKEAEAQLSASKQAALEQTASIDELFKAIDDVSAKARETRLTLEKLVKTRKQEIRDTITLQAKQALADHVASIDATLGGKIRLPFIAADFAGVIKGKKTISSLQDATDTELARAKIEANQVADLIRVNLKALNEHAKAHAFLFADAQQLVLKQADDLLAVIKSRIADHEAAEAKRKEQERERIAAEERAKLEAQAQHAPAEVRRQEANSTSVEAAAPQQPAPTVEAPQRLARECVQISLDEYNALLDAQRTLAALYAAGVDKWDGYGIAMQQLEQEAA